MDISQVLKLDRVKNPAVWLLIGIFALPIGLSMATNSVLDALTQVGLYHPPPIETEPRAMDRGSQEMFLELVDRNAENNEMLKRHDELLKKLVDAQQDVSSAVKSNAITTGVLAQAIKEGFDRVERQVQNHDNEMRRR